MAWWWRFVEGGKTDEAMVVLPTNMMRDSEHAESASIRL